MQAYIREALAPPDDPSKSIRFTPDEILDAGWPVPIDSNGIPDFTLYAPPIRKYFDVTIPICDAPMPSVLTWPNKGEVPKWFRAGSRTFSALAAHSKGLLLDAGCGEGMRSSYEPLGYSYVGIDLSAQSDHCQRRGGQHRVDVIADCHRLPFRSGCMEVVVSNAVIEHLYSPPLFLREAFRVLKPGGLLVGHCSFLEAYHFFSQCHYSFLGLYRALVNAGFVVNNLYPFRSIWDLHCSAFYPGIPGKRALGKLAELLYPYILRLRTGESRDAMAWRLAGVIGFIAEKPMITL